MSIRINSAPAVLCETGNWPLSPSPTSPMSGIEETPPSVNKRAREVSDAAEPPSKRAKAESSSSPSSAPFELGKTNWALLFPENIHNEDDFCQAHIGKITSKQQIDHRSAASLLKGIYQCRHHLEQESGILTNQPKTYILFAHHKIPGVPNPPRTIRITEDGQLHIWYNRTEEDDAYISAPMRDKDLVPPGTLISAFKTIKYALRLNDGSLGARWTMDLNHGEDWESAAKRELAALAQLQGKENIYETWFISKVPYMNPYKNAARRRHKIEVTGPFYEKGDLISLLEKGNLTSPQRRHLVHRITSGMGHLREKAILHRDLKPDNVFVRRADGGFFEPAIGDFGHACSENPADPLKKGTFGTPRYWSPEIQEVMNELQEAKQQIEDSRMDLNVLQRELCSLAPTEDRTNLEKDIKNLKLHIEGLKKQYQISEAASLEKLMQLSTFASTDIWALGTIFDAIYFNCRMLLTLYPEHLNRLNDDRNKAWLSDLFQKKNPMAHLICSMYNENPAKRPTLEEVRKFIQTHLPYDLAPSPASSAALSSASSSSASQ